MISGTSPDGRLVEFVELPRDVHPFYAGTQAHPELKSRPTRAHPLFRGLIAAALDYSDEERLPVQIHDEDNGKDQRVNGSAGQRVRDERRRNRPVDGAAAWQWTRAIDERLALGADSARASERDAGADRDGSGPERSEWFGSGSMSADFAVLESRTLFEGRVISVREDTVRMPDGSQAKREIVGHMGAVVVVALDSDDQIVMVNQYRPAVGARLDELPAGLLDVADEPRASRPPPANSPRRRSCRQARGTRCSTCTRRRGSRTRRCGSSSRASCRRLLVLTASSSSTRRST